MCKAIPEPIGFRLQVRLGEPDLQAETGRLHHNVPDWLGPAMWYSGTFWRLFGASGILVLTSVTLLGAVVVDRVEKHAFAQTQENLRIHSLLVEEMVRSPTVADPAARQAQLALLRPRSELRITLVARNGQVLADSEADPATMENHLDRPEVQQALAEGIGTAIRRSDTTGQRLMYLARRTTRAGEEVACVRVADSVEHILGQVRHLQTIVWLTAGGTGVGALAIAFWLTRRIAVPLRELTGAADRIAKGGYGCKVYEPGPGEVGKLAHAFNVMSECLAAQFAQLEEDRQQLRAVLSGMEEGVVAIDAEQGILFANERAAQLLEFPIQVVVGRKLWQVVRQRSVQDAVRQALAGRSAYREEIDWQGAQVRTLTLHVAHLSGVSARGAVLVFHDTSEVRRLERLRHEFVANVSHELKTPLAVIRACTETLVDGAIDDPEHRDGFLHQIVEQADRLHTLILDLLSLARIESDTELFEFQAVSLPTAVAACVERHRARAETKKQLLEAVAETSSGRSPDADAVAAWADEEAISLLLDNLVDNALKYTPQGGRIFVRWAADADHVRIEVEDTGIGIPEKDLTRIFERFYRVDKARSRELGGTGLGLSIVKHLTQAMKGTVQASSQVGRGSRFTVRLPRVPAD